VLPRDGSLLIPPLCGGWEGGRAGGKEGGKGNRMEQHRVVHVKATHAFTLSSRSGEVCQRGWMSEGANSVRASREREEHVNILEQRQRENDKEIDR